MDTQLVIDPVYPCKVCKVNRPMHYTPEMSHGEMPEGLDLLTCWVCKTTQVRDQEERLKLNASIRKAWAALNGLVFIDYGGVDDCRKCNEFTSVWEWETPAGAVHFYCVKCKPHYTPAKSVGSLPAVDDIADPVDNPVDKL